jgi:acetylglutamate kinase
MKKMVIKIGGELAGNGNLLGQLATEIGRLQASHSCLLVHGGGAELSELMRRVGLEPVFKDGIRMTTASEMGYVDMVLSGQINKRLVRIFQSRGINAVGLSGSDGRLFLGSPIAQDSRTGRILGLDPALVELLMREGYFPVISSTSMDAERMEGLNINADSVAFKMASALRACFLIFISNIPGILKNGGPIPKLTMTEALKEIEEGTITAGMIPKVQASVEALEDGVERILIGEYKGSHDLERLVSGSIGTQIISNNSKEVGNS